MAKLENGGQGKPTRDEVKKMIDEAIVSPTERAIFMKLLEDYAKELRGEVFFKGIAWVVGTVIVGGVSLLLGWPGIKDALTSHVTRQMIEWQIDDYASNKVQKVIEPQLAVLTNNINKAGDAAREISSRLNSTEEIVHLLKLVSEAKSSSTGAYFDLCNASKSNDVARIFQIEVQNYYMDMFNREREQMSVRAQSSRMRNRPVDVLLYEAEREGFTKDRWESLCVLAGRTDGKYVRYFLNAMMRSWTLYDRLWASICLWPYRQEIVDPVDADEVRRWWEAEAHKHGPSWFPEYCEYAQYRANGRKLKVDDTVEKYMVRNMRKLRNLHRKHPEALGAAEVAAELLIYLKFSGHDCEDEIKDMLDALAKEPKERDRWCLLSALALRYKDRKTEEEFIAANFEKCGVSRFDYQQLIDDQFVIDQAGKQIYLYPERGRSRK